MSKGNSSTPATRQRDRRIAWCALGLTLVLLVTPGTVLTNLETFLEPLLSSLKEWKALLWQWQTSDDDGISLPLDKLVHFVLFASCGYWVARGWLGEYSWPGLLLALLCYGVATELIQLFVPGRGLSVGDMVADALGAAFGVIWALRKFRQQQGDHATEVVHNEH